MKKSLKKSMFSLLFLSLIVAIKAQDVLNLEQAIANTLKNNFDIKLAENNQEIAKNNTAVLNAGFLPTLSVGANGNYSIRDTKVELNDGRKAGITDVNGVTYQTSVNLNYLIFDGLGRYYNLQKFKEQHQLSQLQAQFVIENTLLQMTQQFYKVCQQYQTIENLEKTLSISKDRLKKEQYDFDFGQNSKLDVLNASVDFNIDSINLLQATNQLSNDKLILNQLMGVAINTEYIAQTNIAFDGEINLEMLTKQAFENNTALNQYEKNILLSQFDTKIIRANWLPKLNVSGSYAFNNTNNDANSGFNSPLATNYINSYGPSAQLSLTWNLFDGGKTLTQLQNAAIIIENKQIDLAAQKLKLERDITISWQNYKNALAILQIQNQNLETNKLNFLRTQEKYKIGQVNSIQFRQAQQNLLNAENNLNIAKYSAKSLELNLKMQAGKLLESLK